MDLNYIPAKFQADSMCVGCAKSKRVSEGVCIGLGTRGHLCHYLQTNADHQENQRRKLSTNVVGRKRNGRLVTKFLEMKHEKRPLGDVPKAYLYICTESVRVQCFLILEFPQL